MNCLLNRDCTRHCVERAREGHHQTVAEVLHFRPAVRARDVAQHLEVRAPEALRLLIAESLERVGGAHLIRE